jgi:hypothetical protein
MTSAAIRFEQRLAVIRSDIRGKRAGGSERQQRKAAQSVAKAERLRHRRSFLQYGRGNNR